MSFEGEELLGCVVVEGSVLIFSSVQAVPMARTTRPDSPSRSKHCRYPTAAFPPISSTFRPIFLCSSPTTQIHKHLHTLTQWKTLTTSLAWQTTFCISVFISTWHEKDEPLSGLIRCTRGSDAVDPLVLWIFIYHKLLDKAMNHYSPVTSGNRGCWNSSKHE